MTSLYVDDLIQNLEIEITEFSRVYKLGENSGYFIVIEDDEDGGVIFLIIKIGECSADKARKMCASSLENAQRLVAHPEHKTSWQSRDPEKDQGGGAIRISCEDGKTYIFSFSGLTEHAEHVGEALMAYVAFHTGYINATDLRELMIISNNPYFGIVG